MKTLLLFILFSLVAPSYLMANELNLRLSPKQPVMGETFRLIFELTTDEAGTPEISFDPGKAEVLGRDSSVQINTTYINGKLKSERKLTYTYELLHEKNGIYFIRDIYAVVKGKKLTHPALRVHVVEQAMKKKAIFLQSEVDKENFYLGEGNMVHYYLYSKAATVRYEILEFPKLNNFLKSFSEVSDPDKRSETVEVDGEIYYRKLVYRAKVYAEKLGKLTIDPFRLRVQYFGGGSQSPFGTFGLNFSRSRTTTVSSRPLSVEVQAIPAQGVPSSFTGLVGKHKFNLVVPKTKFIVNEAIEVKLEVEGDGALEKYNGPKIYQHKNLEDFDTNSEISINKEGPSQKTFQYTYLARGPIELGENVLPLSYFDPEKKVFVTEKIKVPALSVIGGSGYTTISEAKGKSELILSPSVDGPMRVEGTQFVGPIYSFKAWYWRWFRIINIILLALSVYILSRFYFFPWFQRKTPKEYELLLKNIRKRDVLYGDLYKVLCLIGHKEGLVESSAYQIIEKSSIKDKNKQYLAHLLAKLEEERYKTQRGHSERMKRSVYKDLKRCLT